MIVGTVIETLLASGLALLSAIMLLVVRWVFKVVGEKDKLANQLLVSSIDARLEPRFRKIEDTIHGLKLDVASVKKDIRSDGHG